jgi:2-hydroxy-6-oxonona-2,4-dienedioate hydrolase
LSINTLIDLLLPVSARTAGLRSDSILGKRLGSAAFSKVLAPTLVISLRDDGYGTYASADYTARQRKGAKYVGFEHGGHVWEGHKNEVMNEIIRLVVPLQ